MHPGLDGELPAIQVRFHQYREFLVGDGIHLIGCADHAVAQATGLVEGLEVDGVIGVPVQLQQGLVDALQEADHVGLVVRLLEDTHPDTTELGPALHQRLVAQQQGLAVQVRIAQQHRVYGAGPFHGFLEHGNGDIDPHVIQGLGDFQRAIIEALEIPGQVGNVVFLAIRFRPVGCHDNVATVEILGSFHCVQAPAQQGEVALLRIFVHVRLQSSAK